MVLGRVSVPELDGEPPQRVCAPRDGLHTVGVVVLGVQGEGEVATECPRVQTGIVEQGYGAGRGVPGLKRIFL